MSTPWVAGPVDAQLIPESMLPLLAVYKSFIQPPWPLNTPHHSEQHSDQLCVLVPPAPAARLYPWQLPREGATCTWPRTCSVLGRVSKGGSALDNLILYTLGTYFPRTRMQWRSGTCAVPLLPPPSPVFALQFTFLRDDWNAILLAVIVTPNGS